MAEGRVDAMEGCGTARRALAPRPQATTPQSLAQAVGTSLGPAHARRHRRRRENAACLGGRQGMRHWRTPVRGRLCILLSAWASAGHQEGAKRLGEKKQEGTDGVAAARVQGLGRGQRSATSGLWTCGRGVRAPATSNAGAQELRQATRKTQHVAMDEHARRMGCVGGAGDAWSALSTHLIMPLN
eukprot:364543-Chlamydomonas_euryale.AAC.3